MTPQKMRKILGWSVIGTGLLWGVATFIGWVESVAFISHVSMAALLLETFLAWQNARVEVKQDEGADR